MTAKTFLELSQPLIDYFFRHFTKEEVYSIDTEIALHKLKKLAPFYSQPFSELFLGNAYGAVEPADDYPRGDNAVFEHDTVLEKKSKIREWQEAEKLVLFDGWKTDDVKCAFTNDAGNMIWFRRGITEYKMRTDKTRLETSETFIYPKTLNDFISDCNRMGIELVWRKNIVEKYFHT